MSSRRKLGTCPGCRVVLPDLDAPAPAHLGASPACWALYGRLLVRDYITATNSRVHWLTVASYAVQHPGSSEHASFESMAVHLIALCLLLERGASGQQISTLFARIHARPPAFRGLASPVPNGAITVSNVIASSTPSQHALMVERWARSVWDAWATQHGLVRVWIDGHLDARAGADPG